MIKSLSRVVKFKSIICDDVKIEYSIIENNNFGDISYSLKILADDGYDVDSELLSNITCDTDEILKIYNIFIKEVIMPCTARVALYNFRYDGIIRLIK